MNELEKLLLKYPQINVKQIPWLDIYFKNNPNVTGMAIGGGLNGIEGDRTVAVNPYSTNIDQNSVIKNERLRHYFDEYNITLPRVTYRQIRKYKNTPYQNDTINIGRTEMARYLSGDPSHSLTRKQKIFINNNLVSSHKL